MNPKKSNDLLLIIINKTDTLNEQKTKPQESLQLKLTKSMDTFSLNIALDLEEEKYTIAATNLESNVSVFKKNEQKTFFTTVTPRYWQDLDAIKKQNIF